MRRGYVVDIIRWDDYPPDQQWRWAVRILDTCRDFGSGLTLSPASAGTAAGAAISALEAALQAAEDEKT